MYRLYESIIRDRRIRGLAGQSRYDHIHILNSYPECLFQFWGFEISMIKPPGSADILFEAKRGTHAWAIIKDMVKRNGSTAGVDFYSIASRLAAWPKVEQFIRNIWFEHDVGRARDELGSDNPFAKNQPSVFFGPTRGEGVATACSVAEICSVVYNKIFEMDLDKNVRRAIAFAEECGIEIMQVGFMASRVPSAVRLVFKSSDIVKTNRVLTSFLGWREGIHLNSQLGRLIAMHRVHAIGLEYLGDGSFNKTVGIEVYAKWLDRSAWNGLIDAFYRLPLLMEVSSDKLKGLLAARIPVRERQYAIYKNTCSRCNEYIVFDLFAGLHHFKVSLNEDHELSSPKAYIGICGPQYTDLNGKLVLTESLVHAFPCIDEGLD